MDISEWGDMEEKIAFADADLVLAGHETMDPDLCAVVEDFAHEQISVDDAIATIRSHIQGND